MDMHHLAGRGTLDEPHGRSGAAVDRDPMPCTSDVPSISSSPCTSVTLSIPAAKVIVALTPTPLASAIASRSVQFRLKRLHSRTGAGWLHRQRLRGAGIDRLIPAGPEPGRKRLKPPDN
jgi:hypothetical protein